MSTTRDTLDDFAQLKLDLDSKKSKVNITPQYTRDPEINVFLDDCLSTMKSKGKDYTQGNYDILHNFKTVASEIGVSMERAWAVYFFKHYAALMSYVKMGQVESEPIEGRVKDLIVYLLLFYKMIKERQREEDQDSSGVITK